MKIISIDVGIKNLSFCVFDITVDGFMRVVQWDNINLAVKNESKCMEIVFLLKPKNTNKHKHKHKHKNKKQKTDTDTDTDTDIDIDTSMDTGNSCNKPAKFTKDGQCYCLKHAKNHPYLPPSSELKPAFLNKQKLASLTALADKYKLPYSSPPKKAVLLANFREFVETHCYTAVAKTDATKVDLVTIGRNLQSKFDEIFYKDTSTLATYTVLIENQIGPLANKMTTVQGMITQYFIMKHNQNQIKFISAIHKLQDFTPPGVKLDYKQRKQLSIKTCSAMLNTDSRLIEWEPFVIKHSKKDDLCDCFLQGLWYVTHQLKG
jgi:hypothetical protein